MCLGCAKKCDENPVPKKKKMEQWRQPLAHLIIGQITHGSPKEAVVDSGYGVGASITKIVLFSST